MRKNIYKWHRTFSLIIAIPLALWAASGFMHPIMTNIRPKVGTQWLAAQVIDSSKIAIPLTEALTKNNIPVIRNVRIVKMGGNWFYQLQLPGQKILQYISTQTGMRLKKGDELYARHLAKQFLEGIKKPEAAKQMAGPGKQIPASLTPGIAITSTSADPAKEAITDEIPDCCLNTTVTIMNDNSGAKITSVRFVENFNDEYKYINRLLPAYKVNFDRGDGIRIYVETAQDRFAFAMDNKRAAFDKFFSLFHTMGWLDVMGNGKLVIIIALMLMAFLTTLMGIYIFFITKTKKANGNEIAKARRNHRWVSICISLFTLMFTGSGAFHAFEKFTPDTTDHFFTTNEFMVNDAALNLTRLQTAIGIEKSITNISLVKIDGNNYWQVYNKINKPGEVKKMEDIKGKDLMKSQSVPPPSALYIKTSDYSLLQDGEKKYANNLAGLFSGHPPADIMTTEVITQFQGEYGFVNKRLPVWKVSYASNSNERYYVETSSGKLAARINDRDLVEGYSFSFLHKHHFMDFAGKTARDISTMLWAMAQIAVVTVGLILYFKMRKRKKNKSGLNYFPLCSLF